MFERLDQIEARYEELTSALATLEIIQDSAKYQKTAKAHSEIAPVVERYREYKDLKKGIAESKAVLADEKDSEMRAYAQEELDNLEVRLARVEEELKVLLLPKDPNDEKNVILEIRAGTGGDEATLFAAEIFRMYTRYAETQGWKVEVLSTSESAVGGLKEVIALMAGLLPLDALLEMTNIGTLFAFAVVSGAVLVMRYTNPGAPRPFKVPFMPVTPILGVLSCLLLMCSLPAANWARLFIWMVIGLVIYFAYSRRHGLIGRPARA